MNLGLKKTVIQHPFITAFEDRIVAIESVGSPQTKNCFGVVLSLTANAADSVQRDRYNIIYISLDVVSAAITLYITAVSKESSGQNLTLFFHSVAISNPVF